MKRRIKFLFRMVVALVMSASFSTQVMAELYATGGGSGSNAGLSGLYTVDSLNGSANLVWNFQARPR